MYFECDRIVIFEHGADDLDLGIGMSDKMSAKETFLQRQETSVVSANAPKQHMLTFK